MKEYKVLARKYRPQRFDQVVGQDAVVKTLCNALSMEKVAHAYLFSGSRGTGKTTLARLFAKALNCHHPEGIEPCNACSSCLEITAGSSVDVFEIDGASHRGIEDIRQINKTVGYTPLGHYKIYLIDEVHMLTQEAFNALLKTLEEPPARVKFFFATTEPHKLPATILSRCQHFHLQRIPTDKIQDKLQSIAKELQITIESEAVSLIAHLAQGGLRDAESLFDQVLSYGGAHIQVPHVQTALGLFPQELFFQLDEAAINGNYAAAFSVAKEVFSKGTSLTHFLDQLIFHFRTLLLMKYGIAEDFSTEIKNRYLTSLKLYSETQCLDILEMLTEAQHQIKTAPSEWIFLEMLLIRILRIHQKIPIDQIVHKLYALEERLKNTGLPSLSPSTNPTSPPPLKTPVPEKPKAAPSSATVIKKEEEKKRDPIPTPIQEKPTPSLANPVDKIRQQSRQETILRFAAKELEGSLKNPSKDA